jgi:hypothetical protein
MYLLKKCSFTPAPSPTSQTRGWMCTLWTVHCQHGSQTWNVYSVDTIREDDDLKALLCASVHRCACYFIARLQLWTLFNYLQPRTECTIIELCKSSWSSRCITLVHLKSVNSTALGLHWTSPNHWSWWIIWTVQQQSTGSEKVQRWWCTSMVVCRDCIWTFTIKSVRVYRLLYNRNPASMLIYTRKFRHWHMQVFSRSHMQLNFADPNMNSMWRDFT